MTLLCDEGVDRPIVEALRSAGHRVFYVAELQPGIDDEEVLRRANEAVAVLVTLDKDFGELVFRQKMVTGGVLLLRIAGLSEAAKQRAVVAVVAAHGAELVGSFTVVTRRKVRIRRPM